MVDFNFEEFSTGNLKLLKISEHPEVRAECMRLHPCPQDIEELDASCGDWKMAVYRAANTAGAHACVYKGKVRALFGFNIDEMVYAYIPWLISDGTIQKEEPLVFHKVCKRILRKALEQDTAMYNFAAEDCVRYRWLEGLGFTFGTTRTWVRGVAFRRFEYPMLEG